VDGIELNKMQRFIERGTSKSLISKTPIFSALRSTLKDGNVTDREIVDPKLRVLREGPTASHQLCPVLVRKLICGVDQQLAASLGSGRWRVGR
jgi:hypothetical protein